MFIWTARIHKGRFLLALIAAAAAIALLVFLFSGMRGSGADGASALSSNEARVTYLESWGWKVRSEPVETLQLLMPETLKESEETYNQLQKEQGFDLSKCCGKQVTRYTYAVTNYPDRADGVQVNLYVCDNKPVAGDVIASGTNGFQSGLVYPQ